MNILIILLLVIAGIVAFFLIAALFIKKDYQIVQEVIINKPSKEVFNYIRFLKNQEYYSKWVMMDPHSKKVYKGTDGTVGFTSAWESENKQVGAGEQEIIKIKDGERLDLELRFLRPFKNIAYAHMETIPAGTNQTRVQWVFSGRMNYPFNGVRLFMNMDRMLADDMHESLQTLKTVLENTSQPVHMNAY